MTKRAAVRHGLLVSGVLVLASVLVVFAQRQDQPKASPLPSTSVCPDLSGNYGTSGEDGGANFTIKQTRCERTVVIWAIDSYDAHPRSSHQLKLDGQLRPDSSWFGGSEKQLTAARFRGRVLEVTMESVKQPPTWIMGMFFQQLPNHDICVGDFKNVNQSLPDEGDLWGNKKNGLFPHEEPCRFSNEQR